jgi:hypothetical protein
MRRRRDRRDMRPHAVLGMGPLPERP